MKATLDMVRVIARTCQISSIENAYDVAQAMLDLIDPVPDDVKRIIDKDGDQWDRVASTTWELVDNRERASIFDIVTQYGPITWEGKSE